MTSIKREYQESRAVLLGMQIFDLQKLLNHAPPGSILKPYVRKLDNLMKELGRVEKALGRGKGEPVQVAMDKPGLVITPQNVRILDKRASAKLMPPSLASRVYLTVEAGRKALRCR